MQERSLQDKRLLQYLEKRCIAVDIARRYCNEVDFTLYGKTRTVIGFKNDFGGYELRSPHFKGSSAPKTVTFIDHGTSDVSVFEGFFSYLSFLTINQQPGTLLTNFLVLNSLSFFEKERTRMESHQVVHLYLDRDFAGMNSTQKALKWSEKYNDKSQLYQQHKDINDWLVRQSHPHQRPGQGLERRF